MLELASSKVRLKAVAVFTKNRCNKVLNTTLVFITSLVFIMSLILQNKFTFFPFYLQYTTASQDFSVNVVLQFFIFFTIFQMFITMTVVSF